jgi:hypothetical protein
MRAFYTFAGLLRTVLFAVAASLGRVPENVTGRRFDKLWQGP